MCRGEVLTAYVLPCSQSRFKSILILFCLILQLRAAKANGGMTLQFAFFPFHKVLSCYLATRFKKFTLVLFPMMAPDGIEIYILF